MKTAKSYQGATIVKEFEKSGKPYAHIRIKCDRCVKGVFAIGVENGQIKPHPVANGVCFKCGGLGYIEKDVRLYTEEELDRMEKAKEAANQRRQADREAKMKEMFSENKRKWLLKNGFNENETTFIVTGDSYSIKDELKAAGFIYDSVLKWHKATTDEKYEDRLTEVKLADIAEWSAWGQAHFTSNAKKKIDELIAGDQPQATSVWIAAVGDKIKDLTVKLARKYSFQSKYGMTTVYTFHTPEGNILTWFSSTVQPFEQGDWLQISSATVKELTEYKGNQQTVITRARLKDIEHDDFNWENEIQNG